MIKQSFWLITYGHSRGQGAYWVMTLKGTVDLKEIREQARADGTGEIAILHVSQISPQTFRALQKSKGSSL
jgi:hypothetical protein